MHMIGFILLHCHEDLSVTVAYRGGPPDTFEWSQIRVGLLKWLCVTSEVSGGFPASWWKR